MGFILYFKWKISKIALGRVVLKEIQLNMLRNLGIIVELKLSWFYLFIFSVAVCVCVCVCVCV